MCIFFSLNLLNDSLFYNDLHFIIVLTASGWKAGDLAMYERDGKVWRVEVTRTLRGDNQDHPDEQAHFRHLDGTSQYLGPLAQLKRLPWRFTWVCFIFFIYLFSFFCIYLNCEIPNVSSATTFQLCVISSFEYFPFSKKWTFETKSEASRNYQKFERLKNSYILKNVEGNFIAQKV